MSKITQHNREVVNAGLTKLTPKMALDRIGLMFMVPWIVSTAWAALPGGSLDPTTIPKYATPLYVPPAIPKTVNGGVPGVDYYKIAARQIKQQVLPKTLPKTTLWAYGSSDYPQTFHSPSYTIEATVNRPVRVKWSNDLKDSNGNFLPHLLPVDQTVHWANPPGGPGGQDSMGSDPTPYQGPVPLVIPILIVSNVNNMRL